MSCTAPAAVIAFAVLTASAVKTACAASFALVTAGVVTTVCGETTLAGFVKWLTG